MTRRATRKPQGVKKAVKKVAVKKVAKRMFKKRGTPKRKFTPRRRR